MSMFPPLGLSLTRLVAQPLQCFDVDLAGAAAGVVAASTSVNVFHGAT